MTAPAPRSFTRVVAFRPMTDEDAPQLAAIDAVSNRPPWSEDLFHKELSLPFSFSLIAPAEGRIAGFAVGWALDGVAQLLQLAVAPEFRREGLGARLVQAVLQTARERGARRMTLDFREDNAAARRLYEKCGFQIIAKRKEFYPDGDGLTMERSL